MRSIIRFLLSTIMVLVFIGALGDVTAAAEKRVPVEVSGKIVIIDMTPIPGDWTQVAIETEEGETYILIGKLAPDLSDLEGEEVTIVGVLKTPMKSKGEPITTIEVREVIKEEKE